MKCAGSFNVLSPASDHLVMLHGTFAMQTLAESPGGQVCQLTLQCGVVVSNAWERSQDSRCLTDVLL
jgi:hypothetical protein